MNGFVQGIKEWAGCAFAIALVIGASTYALMRGSSVGAEIRTLQTAADSLNQSAQQAPAAVIDANELEQLSRRRADYEARIRDSAKLGLVVSQLSEEARKAGLQIVEIEPRRPRDANNARYPLFRVTVVGDYQRIATYMHGCRNQRIPARVVEFSVFPASDVTTSSPRVLKADITVEAFATEQLATKEGANGQA